jgi:hypothetical protein
MTKPTLQAAFARSGVISLKKEEIEALPNKVALFAVRGAQNHQKLDHHIYYIYISYIYISYYIYYKYSKWLV